MRIEWRVIEGENSYVFSKEENAKIFIKALVARTSALDSTFDSSPLRPGTLVINRSIVVVKVTIFEDGDDNFALAMP